MRKFAAAALLLLPVALPAIAADRTPRETTLKALVAVSSVEKLERTAISAVIDALMAQATTKEQKEQLEELRNRALAHDTREAWSTAFDHGLDDKTLAALVDCYKTPAMQQTLEITAFTLRDTIQERLKPAETAAAQRELAAVKKTLADMRALATALEARATDTNEYPETADMETLRKLVQPTYIRNMPSRDGWGHEFLYIGSLNHEGYRIVSAGADGVFESTSRRLDQVAARETERPEEDIIFQNGEFLQVPRGFLKNEQD
jgi:hypothetical protein